VEHGFTTIRDLGNQGRITPHELKNLWNESIGPRVFSSGAGFVPKNGQFPLGTSESVMKEEYYLLTSHPKTTFGHHQSTGADLLKIYADEDPNPSYASLKILKQWVRFAHQNGMKVATHAILPKGIDLAINSETDTLEHGTEITSKQLKRMKKKGIVFVPTNAQALFLRNELKDFEVPHNKVVVNKNCMNTRKAIDYKIPTAFGSDNYFSLENRNISFGAGTMIILMSLLDCGLKSEEILKMATSEASKALGKEKELGVLIPGAFADFVVLDHDPLQDLSILKSPKAIYKGGVKVLLGK
jgi:imidazolonepropionase-like amidohydrolase